MNVLDGLMKAVAEYDLKREEQAKVAEFERHVRETLEQHLGYRLRDNMLEISFWRSLREFQVEVYVRRKDNGAEYNGVGSEPYAAWKDALRRDNDRLG